MVDQVLWTRALAIIIGSSVYSFTLILLAFLVGLAGGAAILSRLTARTTRPMEWLAGVHLATAAMIGVSYLVMDKLPAAFLGLLRGGAFSVDGIIFCQFLLAALAVLPATLCMGGVLPLTIRVVARSARVGRPRRRHRLLGQHARRHRRLVRRRLHRAAVARPAARPRHRRRR